MTIARFLGTVMVVFVCFSGHGQTDNYWSWSFNTTSMLMAGSVVGGGAGPSSIFYNPAQIGIENTKALSLSASIISIQFFRADNIAGEGIDANKVLFKVQPRFVSYLLPSKKEKWNIELVILTPSSGEIDYVIHYLDEFDLIERTIGEEIYSGYIRYNRKYTDTWIGAGVSNNLGKNWSIGGSAFLSIKNLKYYNRSLAQAYQNSDSVLVGQILEAGYIALHNREEEFKYWNLSLALKLGIFYTAPSKKYSLGLNLSLPNLNIYGEADLRKSYSRSNVHDDQSQAFTRNEAFNESHQNVRSHVSTPFSVAFGIRIMTFAKLDELTITAEYFHSIEPYSLASAETQATYIPQTITPPFEGVMSYNSSANSVTNIALGMRKRFTENFELLGGLRTDFSALGEDMAALQKKYSAVTVIPIDKYHLTLGPVFVIRQFEILSGIQYTFGRNKNFEQVINFTDAVEYDAENDLVLEGLPQNNASAHFNEISLFLGLIVDLN
jgi:hypothetical protein